AGSSFGRGARWPLSTSLYGALRSALLAEAGALPSRTRPGARRKGVPDGQIGTDAFQWLHVHGPFPVRENRLYFPRPADLVRVDKAKAMERMLPIAERRGKNNLPRPLRYCVASFASPSKEERPIRWVDHEFYKAYLAGERLGLPEDPELWDSERRIGVAIDPNTRTAKEGQLYVAEHLRLREGVALRFAASDPPKHKARHPEERDLTVASLCGRTVSVGGEGRFARVELVREPFLLPGVDCVGRCVKWVLLSPAIFAHGWLPGWIEENSGKVLLRSVEKESRREFRRRRREDPDWSYRDEADPAERITAHLVAACLGKPEPLGGWDLLYRKDPEAVGSGGAKATLLSVSAGSVYYFEAADEREAQKLVSALHGRCRSDFLGEKGLGLGVCGSWRLAKEE
ncbi:type III-B CRISPR module-associated Cmr3 family protein, partial [Methylacidimicrobium cyclopophantes]|uniref:type III-B CRISPR module-associated Cmr3 family protein n=1 Tax=Methylacidimicrobium cyclopophantes TaxID=1041766 RepID=UPI001159364E